MADAQTWTLFTDYFTRLDNSLAVFVASKAAAVAELVSPAITGGMSLYFVIQGIRHWKGEVEQPLIAFIEQAIKMAVISSAAVNVAWHQQYLGDLFQNSPVMLATALSGQQNATSASLTNNIGAMLDGSLTSAWNLFGTFWHMGTIGGWLTAIPIFIVTVAVLGYAAFLIVMSKLTTALAMALAPFFIGLLLFERTKQWFSNWIGVMFGGGMVIVLTVGAHSLLMTIFQETAQDAAATGNAGFGEILPMVFSGLIAVLVLAQITGIASSMSGGFNLSTLGFARYFGRHAEHYAGKGAGWAGGKAKNLATAGVQKVRDMIRTPNTISDAGDRRAANEHYEPRRQRSHKKSV